MFGLVKLYRRFPSAPPGPEPLRFVSPARRRVSAPLPVHEPITGMRHAGAHQGRVEILTGAADTATVVLSAFFAHCTAFGCMLPPLPLWTGVLVAALAFAHLSAAALRPKRGAPVKLSTEIAGVCLCWCAAVVPAGIVLFLLGDLQWRWAAPWIVVGGPLLALTRLASRNALLHLARGGFLGTHIAIVGPRAAAKSLARTLVRSNDEALKSISMLPIDHQELACPAVTEALRRDLRELSLRAKLDEIILVGYNELAPLERLLRCMVEMPVDIHLCRRVPSLPEIPGRFALVGGIPMLSVAERPLSDTDLVLKRLEDVVLSGLLIAFLLPLMALIAVAVKIDSPGPVLFRQARSGYRGELISVLKFRSMHVRYCADRLAPQATRNDRRTTRLGQLLRKTSLDELPQLFNVFRGDMSLVGPRPHPLPLDEGYEGRIQNYLARRRVRPGLTGWAQVNGLRGGTDTVEKMGRRVEHDLYYIEHWSLLFDLWILVMTLRKGFMDENAY